MQLAAREGDRDALAVIDEFGRWVALGLVNLTNVLDPEMFVLGGGLAAGADLYLGPIQTWFGELIYAPEPAHPSRAWRSPTGTSAPAPSARPLLVQASTTTIGLGGRVVGRSRRGSSDLAPGFLAASHPERRAVLVGLERLVDLEEVLDLGAQLRGQVLDVV